MGPLKKFFKNVKLNKAGLIALYFVVGAIVAAGIYFVFIR